MSDNNFEFDTMSMNEDDYKLFKMMGMHGDNLSEVEDEAKALVINTTDYGDYGCMTRIVAPSDWFSSEDDFRDKLKTMFFSQIKDELDIVLSDSAHAVCELIETMGLVGFRSYITYNDLFIEDKENEAFKSGIKKETLRNLFIYMFFERTESEIENSKDFNSRASKLGEILIDSLRELAVSADSDESKEFKQSIAEQLTDKMQSKEEDGDFDILDIETLMINTIIDNMTVDSGMMGITSDSMSEQSLINAYAGLIDFDVFRTLDYETFTPDDYNNMLVNLFKNYLEGYADG